MRKIDWRKRLRKPRQQSENKFDILAKLQAAQSSISNFLDQSLCYNKFTMSNQIWNLFPRLLEQQINGLLETAEPNPSKAFQLYKICQNEDLWKDSYQSFSVHLKKFFSLPFAARSKGVMDSCLDSPMNMYVYECFHLNFRTAQVNPNEISNIASWAHQLMRTGHKKNLPVISTDILTKTLPRLT